ncbi:MAG: FtsX-like permease family protein [Bacteroidia bacterium]
MNPEFFIAKRLSYRNDKNVFSTRPIIRIALAGVAVGFAVMILAVAIVTGFKKEIREKVIGFGAHIQISNFDENNSFESKPVSRQQPFIAALQRDSDISHIQVFATKAAIVKSSGQLEGIVAKGIGSDFDSRFFREKMKSGKFFTVHDGMQNDSIVISSNLASKLSLKTGDDLVMFFIQQPPRARRFHIAGIYETGLEEFDNLYLFCDISQIQKLNDWGPDLVGGFEISIRDFNKLDEVGTKVYKLSGSELNSRTIKEIYPQIFDWLGLQNINSIIIITLMIIVSGMNMISALLIIILERVKMIGLLKTMGAPNVSVRRIFIYLAGMLTVRGLIAGNLIGLVILYLQSTFKIFTLDQQSYYISYVPTNINFSQILYLNAGTLVICLIMMILPTFLITRISPMSAVRYD